MGKTNKLHAAVEAYIRKAFLRHLPSTYLFHNFEHVTEVVEVVQQLAKRSDLSSDEKDDLTLAAWFHELGYIRQREEHEQVSAELAKQFLTEQGYEAERITRVTQLILSTQADHEPIDLSEKILFDAQWSFLGRKRFSRKGRLLLLENEQVEGTNYTQQERHKILLDLQLETSFYTTWANDKYYARRIKNISAQRENFLKAQEKTIRRKTGKNFGRGIDTLYRITLRNHLNLSSIADGKANMIISINTLVLSILITAGTATLSLENLALTANFYIIAPIIVLMLSSLLAIIFAVLSAIPKVEGATFVDQDIKQHKVSLLFFGNFLQLEKEKYVDHLRGLKKDQELLYDDLSRDLYNLGKVLKKKYTLLTIAYRLFMGGLISTVIVFLLAYFLS